MKYETKVENRPLSKIYNEMVNNDWELDYYDKEEVLSLWKRKIKKERNIKTVIKTPEFIEFIKKYKEIKKN